MQCNSFNHWSRLLIITLISVFTVSCGTGDGETPITDSLAGGTGSAPGLTLVFEDDFGGPVAASRLAGKSALTADNWRVETGYGPNNDGWGNNEWQLYTDSTDNLYIENGSLVLEARCDTAPNCNSQDGTITSAKINTKDKLEIKYGRIQARIKTPGGMGMWPAFWMLGSEFPEKDWPDVGEIDIMEMFYLNSDTQTTHFSTHWAGPNDAATTAGCSGIPGAVNPTTESENCFTQFKTFDEPLTDDFHVYEVDWDDKRIIGKIDGVTYFTQAIDPATMEEFQAKFFLLLNVAVGGNAGGAPDASTTWPQQMLVDWVKVFKKEKRIRGSLISESETNIPYIRIFNSVEFGGNTAITDLTSTAVTPLEGSNVMEVKYAITRTGNPGGTNGLFGGPFFGFIRTDITDFTTFRISIDASAFPGFDDLAIEFKDSSDRLVQVPLSNYTPTSTSGNWSSYAIPLSDFAGVDLSDMLFIGLLNPVNEGDQLIAGTLYFDDIRFTTEACTAVGSVAFDSLNYNPSTNVASVSIDDICAANSLATVKITAGTDEIVVGVDLDAAGQGEAFFGLLNPRSVCTSSDQLGILALSPPLIATYTRSFINDAGVQQVNTATATAGIDENAPGTSIVGNKSYIYATSEPADFAIDGDFILSDFSTGSIFEFNFTGDTTFSPVFQVNQSAGAAGFVAFLDREGDGGIFPGPFAVNAESFNFKVKGVPNDSIEVGFGDPATNFPVNLQTYSGSTDIGGGWFEVSIPMSEFTGIDNDTFFVRFSSDNTSTSSYSYLITDIFLQGSASNVPEECATLIVPPVAGSGTGDTGATGGDFSVSFDDPNVTYNFTGFGGPDTITVTAADPEKATNLVAQTTKPTGAATFAGVTVEPVPGITYPLSATNNEMSIRIYAPGAGVTVRMKLEDSANAANFVEVDAVTTVDTGWETLTFTFTNPPAFTYDKLTLFFGFGAVGDGTVYTWDTIEFLGTVTPPPTGGELLTNGTFEAGDISGWTLVDNNGTFTATMDQAASGAWSGNLVASVPGGGGLASFPLATQVGLAVTTVAPGQTVNVSFDICGTVSGAGGVFQSALLSEIANDGGASATDPLFGNIPLTETWTNYSTSLAAGADVTGGITLQLKADCGGNPGCTVNAYIDNVSVTLDSDVGNVSNAGGSCAAPTPPPAPNPTGSVFFDSVAPQWDGSSLSAFDQALNFSSCTDDDGAGCPSIGWSVVAATDTAHGDVIDVAYANSTQFAGLVIGQPATPLDFTQFAGGNIVFDLNVTNNPGNVAFIMKVDCTGCPTDAGQREQALGVPGAGWQTFSVPVDDLINANGGPTAGGLKIDQVTTGLVVFPAFGQTSGITYQIDNVRWEATGAVFEEVVANQWDGSSLSAFDQALNFSSCTDDDGAGCPSIGWSVVAATDTAHGDVIDVAYANSTQFAGLVIGQPATPLDFTQFAGGNIVFDLNVTNNPGNVAFLMKVDCTGCPTDAGQREQNLGVPGAGWQTFTVAVDDMINANGGPTAGGLRIDQVTTGLVVFPAFGQTSGITYQVDNVRWEAAGDGDGGGGAASGTATINFESGGFGADFNWVTFENDDNPALQVISNPVSGTGNTSATVGAYTARAAGQDFAGFESGPGDFGLYVIDASTRYVKMWVYKTKISDVGMQLTVGAAARPEVRVANTVTNQWEQLTFDFNELIGFGEWATGDITKLVVFPDFAAGRTENTIYIDNISFGPDP